jgi:hypothetical protein
VRVQAYERRAVYGCHSLNQDCVLHFVFPFCCNVCIMQESAQYVKHKDVTEEKGEGDRAIPLVGIQRSPQANVPPLLAYPIPARREHPVGARVGITFPANLAAVFL